MSEKQMPMTGYAIRFAFFAALLFSLVYFDGFSPLIFVSEAQTALTVFLTGKSIALFSLPVGMEGTRLVFAHGMRLSIFNECNGLASILLFSSAVLAFPTLPKQKFSWLLAGYTLLSLFNLIRIVATAYAVSYDPAAFWWSHDIAGRYGTGLITLTVFWRFAYSVKMVRPSGIFFFPPTSPFRKESVC